MSNTPYLYVIRKKHDVDDLDKWNHSAKKREFIGYRALNNRL